MFPFNSLQKKKKNHKNPSSPEPAALNTSQRFLLSFLNHFALLSTWPLTRNPETFKLSFLTLRHSQFSIC